MTGITKPLRSLFPVSGDDPALIGFYFGNNNEDSTFKRAKELPDESAVVASARWRLEDRTGLIDREHRLFHGKAALACALFDMRGVMKFVRRRIANYVVD